MKGRGVDAGKLVGRAVPVAWPYSLAELDGEGEKAVALIQARVALQSPEQLYFQEEPRFLFPGWGLN